jgi:methyl-accepting chemotaxis protein PixJ
LPHPGFALPVFLLHFVQLVIHYLFLNEVRFMTQLSPKPGSNKNSNGRVAYPTTVPVEGRMSANNYPSSLPLPGQFYQGQQATQWLPPEEMKQISQTQGSRRPWQLGFEWFSKSLRLKATVLALTIGTLPVVALGVATYTAIYPTTLERNINNQQVRNQDFRDKLTFFLNFRYRDIIAFADLDALSNPKLKNEFNRQKQEEILDRLLETYEVYNNIAVFDLKGNLLAQSRKGEPIPDDANHFDREYFQAALKTDRPFMGSPEKSTTSGLFSIYTAAPVKDKTTGKTIAIIRARLPVRNLQEVLGTEDNTLKQQYYLTDEAGTIFATSENKFLGQKVEQIFPELAQLIKQKGREELSNISYSKATQEEALKVYSPTQRLSERYNLNWGLIISRPSSAVFVITQQLFSIILVSTAITVVVVAAIAAFLANRATRPIIEAAKAVDKIGQGELDTRLVVQGEDELAQLEANINDMAGQLQSFTQEQILLAKVAGSRAFSLQELDAVFNNAIEDARQILKADRLIIYRFNPDFSGYIAAEAIGRGLFQALDNKIEDAIVSEQLLEAYKGGLVTPLNNVYETNLYPHQMRLAERLQFMAVLEAPILQQGQPYGLLMALYSIPHEWQPSEVNFFKQLAAQFGLSLDRVTLLKETEALAQEQKQLKEELQQRALELLKEVDPISKGDLTIRAKVTADEIGTIADSYNVTVANLRKIVTQVQQAASQVAETTSNNGQTVQSLSTEALRQAEEIGQALERAQEMAQSVREVAHNAQLAEAAVQEAAQTVEEGDEAMNRTVDGILAIRETVAETAKKVKHLGESSQKISTVVNLISTFAAQTNLLALNASIEAARAGEEGRGFAVVADEVRALARQSAEATSEIEKLVAAIQAETNEVVAAMEAGTEQVVTGTKLVDETRQSLNKITAASLQINNLVESITQATVVQAQASEAVTETMTKVAQSAEKTSQEANYVSSSFEQLLTVAQALQEDVRRFKVS